MNIPNTKTPLLDQVDLPQDLRQLDKNQLRQFADELRTDLIDTVSVTGGHFGSSLGVVELTTALHYVFKTPDDRIIWDVGHQAYPHKILTGRRSRMRTLRQGGGLSGFTKRSESEYDPFGAAHSSTSISAGVGMAVARDLKGGDNHVIAVIGDGSMSAGMAYEAMNNAGANKSRLIVILNDNDMSIAPPVGAMSAYLARLVSSRSYTGIRNLAKRLGRKLLPRGLFKIAQRTEEYARGMAMGGTLFEEMGFYYVGPIDGHNLDHLVPVLENVRDTMKGPVLVHVVTKKGHGYEPAERAPDKYHAVTKFTVLTGEQSKSTPKAPAYQKVFGEALIAEAAKDERIVAITAAMPSGTGIDLFEKAFPTRTFDVGIAEQHGVTFAAGMATEGMKPFCAIYSTFLQRAYDQVVHDVAIQCLPVRFAMDRAGLVGADGATHAGSFDIAYLAALPNFVIMAPSDESELVHMVATAAAIDDRPSALRYPRGEGTGIARPDVGVPLEIGKGRIIKEGTGIAILSFGTRMKEVLLAAERMAGYGLSPTIADARFAKPLDTDLIRRLAKEHEILITIEEGSAGGFGAHVMHFMAHDGLLDRGLKVRPMTLPDVFQDHDTPEKLYAAAGLDADGIVRTALTALGRGGEAVHLAAGKLALSQVCPHFGTCGGCTSQDLAADAYAASKRDTVVTALAKAGVIADVLAPVIVPPRSRRRAAFKIASRIEGLHIGFHAAKSHTVIDMHHCDVLTPALFALVARLRVALERLMGTGETADLHVTETDTGFDAAFRWKRNLTPGLITELSRALGGIGIARLSLNDELVFETAAPAVSFDGIPVKLPPNPFLQSTADGEVALQSRVQGIVGKAKTIADLFSGVGTFALPLARKAKVHAVEHDTAALAALAAAAKSPGLKRVTTETRDLFKLPLTPPELAPYDAVVLDPPRAGAENQARALTRSKVANIAYVSCDAASFARDAAILTQGGYVLGPVTPIDQFLWSSHIELVAGFNRPQAAKR